MRLLKYHQAINEALRQKMEGDKTVFLIGQGCTSPWYVGGTCDGLLNRFGASRVIDTPISENAITGAAVGAAIAGMRPVLVFPRMDFMMYAMDPIVNQAAKWHYMFGGAASVPLVIWAIINRGGCQGAQHSQDFTWLFANIPGLKVVSPENGYLAKGLLISAIEDNNPVVFVDDRWRYEKEDNVPKEMYRLPLESYLIKGEEYPWCPVPCSEPLEKEYFTKLNWEMQIP